MDFKNFDMDAMFRKTMMDNMSNGGNTSRNFDYMDMFRNIGSNPAQQPQAGLMPEEEELDFWGRPAGGGMAPPAQGGGGMPMQGGMGGGNASTGASAGLLDMLRGGGR